MTLPYASSTTLAPNPLSDEERKAAAWTWSFSKYRQFKDCNERYRLQYVERLKIPPLSQKPFFQGSVAHKLMEQTREKLQKGDVSDWQQALVDLDPLFDQYAQNIDWVSDQELAQARLEAVQIARNYIALLEEHRLGEGEVYCEHWFGTYPAPLVRPSGLRLVGAIDWIKLDRDTNTATIFDAKTSQGTQYLDKDQLTLYALAVRQQFGVEVGAIGYLMLRWKRTLLKEVTLADMERLEEQMCEASRWVEQGVLKVSPTMQMCGQCQYSGHCHPFKGWIIDGGTRQETEW